MESVEIIMEQNRFYRRLHASEDLIHFNVKIKETDLDIGAQRILTDEAKILVKNSRQEIEDYIQKHPEFLVSLAPLPWEDNDPLIIKNMMQAAKKAGVGPMAAVAGAIAQYVGQGLLRFSREIIVENGGDIYIKSHKDRIIGIYAGDSPLSGKVGLKIRAEKCPMGICTSSGKVGHSLSFGQAHAVAVLATDTALADAVATAAGNIIKTEGDIQATIDFAKKTKGIKGIVVIIKDRLGAWGDIELVRL